jgi:hypothetical protein
LENIAIIKYHGSIQYETIGELIHQLKLQVHHLGIQVGTYKRILLVMIESLENIIKHSEKANNLNDDDDLKTPTLTILKNDHHFQVISSNLISGQVIQILKDKIDYLNKLDQQALKDYYKETITNGHFTNTGGAGLGLIEIAKISGKMIKYEFKPVNEQYFRYTQWITINEKRI